MDKFEKNNYSLKLIEGDITALEVDAIVNAANTSLILGGGVAGAIRSKGGPKIQEECYKLAPIKTGEAVATNAGNLRAKFIIHTAGPVYERYEPAEAERLLGLSMENTLKFIEKKSLSSIAFPAISAGIYGFPANKVAEIMISSAIKYISNKIEEESIEESKNASKIEIIFCLYGQNMYHLFCSTLEKLVKMK